MFVFTLKKLSDGALLLLSVCQTVSERTSFWCFLLGGFSARVVINMADLDVGGVGFVT